MRNHIEIDKEKSIYDQGLSVMLFAQRTDRLNEWQMDEVADKAADLENEIKALRQQLDDIHSKDRSMLSYHAKYQPKEYMRHVTQEMIDKHS